jgi:hypothetical protein
MAAIRRQIREVESPLLGRPEPFAAGTVRDRRVSDPLPPFVTVFCRAAFLLSVFTTTVAAVPIVGAGVTKCAGRMTTVAHGTNARQPWGGFIGTDGIR